MLVAVGRSARHFDAVADVSMNEMLFQYVQRGQDLFIQERLMAQVVEQTEIRIVLPHQCGESRRFFCRTDQSLFSTARSNVSMVMPTPYFLPYSHT